MDKSLDVVDQHECKVLEKFNARLRKTQYGIQRYNNHWYWVRWNNKLTTADGIAYCPYCGQKL